MIKKTVLFTVTLSAMASAILAADTQAKVSFALGDVVHIDTCDKWQWCKLKDNSGYVKGHLFKRFPKDPSIAIKHTKGNTYLYNIRPVYKDDKPIFEFIQKENPVREMLFAQDNYQYGYIREKDIADYEIYINTQQIQKPKKEVAKQDVTQKVEEIVGKTQESNSKDINEVKLEDTNDEVLYAKDNFKYGYVREKDKALYDEYMLQKANAQTKPIAETKLDTTSEVAKEEKPENTNVSSATTSKAKYFIYGGIGTTSATIDNGIASTTLTNDATDKSGMVYAFGVGYNYNTNIFTTLEYQQNSFEQVDISNLLVSANYRFNDVAFQPYVGAILGYSNLEWSKAPIATTITKDEKASTVGVGLQLGLDKRLDEKFSIFGQYQYINLGHETKINTEILKHDSVSNFIMGVKYDL
jgi:opacity protein-like surface antigen